MTKTNKKNSNAKIKTEELSEEQIESVSAAGAPKKGIVACSSPSGDFTGKRSGVTMCTSPDGDFTGKRKGVHACTSPNGD